MFLFEMLLIFVVRGIPAYIAFGTPLRKVGWYAGTAALTFFADVFAGAFGMAMKETGHSSGATELAALFMMLMADVAMIVWAANTGKRCGACQSRVHPKAIRCPKCQSHLVLTC